MEQGTIVAGIIAFGALAAAITAVLVLSDRLTKPLKSLKEDINNIDKKLDSFRTWQKSQQIDIEASKSEREILCRGFRALSNWAIAQGANGEIKRGLDEISEFLSTQAHSGTSFLHERV
jgi:hypothetical protein